MVCESFVSSLSPPGPPEDTQLTGVRIGRVRIASAHHVTEDSHNVIGVVSGGFGLWCWDGAQILPCARLVPEFLPSLFLLYCIYLFLRHYSH